MVPLENSGGAWLNYLRAWLIIGLADVSSQALMQRGFSARNEQVAQNSFYVAGIGYLTFGMIPVILGIIGSVTMPGLADPETVIPELALAHLHPIAIAVFVGALLAAIMSSADSSLLAAASVLSNNLVPLVARSAKDRLRLLSARISIVLFGIIAVVVATEVKVVYNLMLDANSIILVCVSVPFILGVWWKKANRAGALASMLAGSLTWIGVELLAPDLPGDLAGMLAALLTMLVVTPATQVIDPPRPLLTADGEEIQLKDRLGILPVLRRAG
jgi:Na+/proline symporter